MDDNPMILSQLQSINKHLTSIEGYMKLIIGEVLKQQGIRTKKSKASQ